MCETLKDHKAYTFGIAGCRNATKGGRQWVEYNLAVLTSSAAFHHNIATRACHRHHANCQHHRKFGMLYITQHWLLRQQPSANVGKLQRCLQKLTPLEVLAQWFQWMVKQFPYFMAITQTVFWRTQENYNSWDGSSPHPTHSNNRVNTCKATISLRGVARIKVRRGLEVARVPISAQAPISAQEDDKVAHLGASAAWCTYCDVASLPSSAPRVLEGVFPKGAC